jgi:hypothetical protein
MKIATIKGDPVRHLLLSAIGLLALLATGCTTTPSLEEHTTAPSMTQQQFETFRMLIRERPMAQRDALSKCIELAKTQLAVNQKTMALILGVENEADAVSQVYCRRVLAGIASGRINLEDMQALEEQRGDTGALNRVLPVLMWDEPEIII